MKVKDLYESPAVDMLELRNEGVICASVDVSGINLADPFGNNPDELSW